MTTNGERIRYIRKSKGLTQKALGELCGIAEPTIRRYELGKLNPKYETLQKIAKAMYVPISDFFETYDISELSGLSEAPAPGNMNPNPNLYSEYQKSEETNYFIGKAGRSKLSNLFFWNRNSIGNFDIFYSEFCKILSILLFLNKNGRSKVIEYASDLSNLNQYCNNEKSLWPDNLTADDIDIRYYKNISRVDPDTMKDEIAMFPIGVPSSWNPHNSTIDKKSIVHLASEQIETEEEARHFAKAVEKSKYGITNVIGNIVYGDFHLYSISSNWNEKIRGFVFANWS